MSIQHLGKVGHRVATISPLAGPARIAADGAQDDPQPVILDKVKPLGLQPKPAKEQAEFLVIDHIEKLSEN
jgi:hypothetical protein